MAGISSSRCEFGCYGFAENCDFPVVDVKFKMPVGSGLQELVERFLEFVVHMSLFRGDKALARDVDNTLVEQTSHCVSGLDECGSRRSGNLGHPLRTIRNSLHNVEFQL
jgi:hypothetical protein